MKKSICLIIALLTVICTLFCGCEGLENLSGTITDPQPQEPDNSYTSGAAVIIDGTTTHYENVAEAWKAANSTTDKAVKFTLYQDWEATEGSFGLTGVAGFDGAGGLSIVERANNATLDICFNGHKIDRKIFENENYLGAVFSICSDNAEAGDIYFSNGTISGGWGYYAGGIYISCKSTIKLTNMIVSGNKGGIAGGIFLDKKITKTHLINTTIEGNYGNAHGGGIYVEDNVKDASQRPALYVSGKVRITNNYKADESISNLYYKRFFQNEINGLKNLEEGSVIGLDFRGDTYIFGPCSTRAEAERIQSLLSADCGSFEIVSETTKGCQSSTSYKLWQRISN